MSGFFGSIRFDGAPADEALAQHMADRVRRHGAGEVNSETAGAARLGLAPLQATPAHARGPVSLDGRLWLCGDIRLDARRELIASLAAQGLNARGEHCDAELTLLAFQAWGPDCVERFTGDFAFLVWDPAEKTAFAARDVFGVKPFYYAAPAGQMVFSNDLDAVRCHPGVGDGLHEPAIADFLAFGHNQDERSTVFRDVLRLPPGHTLAIEAGRASEPRPYRWVRFDTPIRYARPVEYLEHFSALFEAAVGDRLDSDRVGFELSGGMDSGSVAATAARLGRSIPGFRALAITTDNRQLDPDDREPHLAGLLAERYGIEHRCIEAGPREDLFAHVHTPQPYAWPFAATSLRFGAQMRAHGRVMFSGQGGDVFFSGSGNYLLDLWRDQSLPRVAKSVLSFLKLNRSLAGLGIGGPWRRATPRIEAPPLPPWLNAAFMGRAGSVERWRRLFYAPCRYDPGCSSELAWDTMRMPIWSHIMEDYYHDLFHGIECRHPLFDVRLARFLLSIPGTIKADKWLLRAAMRGRLPEEISARRKTTPGSDLVGERLKSVTDWNEISGQLAPLADWVDVDRYLATLRADAPGKAANRVALVTPLGLGFWLSARPFL